MISRITFDNLKYFHSTKSLALVVQLSLTSIKATKFFDKRIGNEMFLNECKIYIHHKIFFTSNAAGNQNLIPLYILYKNIYLLPNQKIKILSFFNSVFGHETHFISNILLCSSLKNLTCICESPYHLLFLSLHTAYIAFLQNISYTKYFPHPITIECY